jgi:hypothetical protein
VTWLIDPGRFPVIGAVTEYLGSNGPTYPMVREGAFSAEEIDKFPKEAKFHARTPGREHIILDQKGYLLLSKPALDALASLQTSGWSAIPLKVIGINAASRKAMASDPYYLLNLFLKVDAFDLVKGDVPPQLKGDVPPQQWNKGTPLEKTVYALDHKYRKIAIRADAVPDLAIWTGLRNVFGNVIFVSNELRSSWCALGVTEALFEPCLDA